MCDVDIVEMEDVEADREWDVEANLSFGGGAGASSLKLIN